MPLSAIPAVGKPPRARVRRRPETRQGAQAKDVRVMAVRGRPADDQPRQEESGGLRYRCRQEENCNVEIPETALPAQLLPACSY